MLYLAEQIQNKNKYGKDKLSTGASLLCFATSLTLSNAAPEQLVDKRKKQNAEGEIRVLFLERFL